MGRREVKLRDSGGARTFRLTVASCPRNFLRGRKRAGPALAHCQSEERAE